MFYRYDLKLVYDLVKKGVKILEDFLTKNGSNKLNWISY